MPLSPHRVEVALPARPLHCESLLERHRLDCQSPQGQVHGLALGAQPELAHHRGTGLVVDVDVRSGHTPTLRQLGSGWLPDPAVTAHARVSPGRRDAL